MMIGDAPGLVCRLFFCYEGNKVRYFAIVVLYWRGGI